MRHIRSLFKFPAVRSAVLVAGLLAACSSGTMDPYYDLVRSYGYTPYTLPRSDYGPGLVFVGSAENGKVTVERIICSDIFPALIPTRADVTAPSTTTTRNANIEMGLNLLGKIIGNKNKVQSNLEVHKIKEVKIQFLKPTELYYRGEDLFENGSPRLVADECYEFIQTLKENGELADNVMIVDAALEVGEMDYIFAGEGAIKLGADVSWSQILDTNAGGGFESKEAGTLVVTESRYVGASRIMRLKDWAATGQVTGGGRMVVLTAEPVSLSDTEVLALQ